MPAPTLASFEHFAQKASGAVPAGFARAKTIRVAVAREDLSDLSQDELRTLHAGAMVRFRENDQATAQGSTLLDLKLELARRLLAPCTLCALECRVDRTKGPAGACGLGPGLSRYQDFVHEGEEPEISPTHAILLAGCNYRCSYCSDWDHVETPLRDPASRTKDLARSIEARRKAGVASLSWIGGDPGVSLPGILEALSLAETSVPVVWNSNMHSTEDARDLLEGIVDAYVADWKHGNDDCARAVAGAPGHVETVRAAIARASREAFTIVRHLVIPGHVECCTIPVLEGIARDLPGVRVNLMAQYRPNANVRGTPLDRRPSKAELERAHVAARELRLDLSPRGQLASSVPARPVESGPLAEGPAFESSIYVDDDGNVTFENLSPELSRIAHELGSVQGEGGAAS